MLNQLINKLHGLKEMLFFDNYMQLILNRLLFHPNVEVYSVKGLEIIVDRLGGDANGVRTCLASRMYKQFFDLMSLPREGGVILDLGANSGGFSLLLLLAKYQPKSIVAVELNPDTYRRLSLNLWRNFINTKVTVINAGVYSSSGLFELRFSRGSTSDSIQNALSKNNGNQRVVQCEMITLDQLIEQQLGSEEIDLCKVDIEGAEWDIFFGDSCHRVSQCRFLLMEIHPSTGKNSSDMLSRLEQLGMSFVSKDEAESVYLFRRLS